MEVGLGVAQPEHETNGGFTSKAREGRERLDARTPGAAGGIDPYLGAVDKEHRPRYHEGQTEVRAECLQGCERAADSVSADAAGRSFPLGLTRRCVYHCARFVSFSSEAAPSLLLSSWGYGA